MSKVLKGGLWLIAALLLLMAIGIAWFWMSVRLPDEIPATGAAPRGDTVLSEFYVPPAQMPKQPGALIRQETLEGESTLEQAAENIRLLYSSTDGLDKTTIRAVSGALYLPAGGAPAVGWPVLLWSHGTVGIGDVCAPSYAGRSERDRTYLGPWLEAGFAIAASDYQGLGTPGTHPYMDARSMAYDNLDLARALQGSDLPLSDTVLIAGQSQGATGALATASYAADYAPQVNLAAVMATGIPHFSPSVMWDIGANTDRDEVSTAPAFSLYMMAFAEMLDPDFRMDDVVSDKARPIADKVGEACVFDFISAIQEAELSTNSTFSKAIEIPLIKVFSRAGLYDLGFDTPVFTGTGTADQITPYPMQQAFLADACEAGMRITAEIYDGANHNEGLLNSIPDAQSFAQAVLDGRDLENTCAG